ncbi:YaeQ family protein [Paenalcaligenes niemegkensis]|uniref:YaeQ family protein n=1 Tax=Paenalcaligenes niemegkensis TaxID=2895469 RepID=UPI001EE8E9DC|nr:YaeQ family protein [Paenalcaligenes niemegkensis]MCQ9616162.1 YaeQ family protein [Paenalcaligenes niemegkensis]
MALRSTIYKADLHIADNDRPYYATHSVTAAKHPSETEERLMVRLLAYAVHSDDTDSLAFALGLSDANEPDLWRRDLTGAIQQWIEVGLPDDRRLIKAAGRANEVIVYAYGRNVDVWWKGIRNKVARIKELKIFVIPETASDALTSMVERSMSINLNVQDKTIWVSSAKGEATIELRLLS